MAEKRQLRPEERRVLERMLHSGIEKRDEYLQQLQDAMVEPFGDNDPGLLFVHPPTENQHQSGICEAEYTDTDGVKAEVSLRANGPYLHVLDIYKVDPSDVIKFPEPDELDIYWPAEKGKKGWWEE